ncbi:helix-turn-helix transcriptional regulator [Nitrospirillum sp. BR 11164]|uniref:AraC family transcriptional regulator n=1 Tax=Nitrospirillum sp. BR 11164 TaxID=3104324 RepID=UPI002AFFE35C|nr:helix-turn-helix transcriptional regulator [Nitrospirillum sp. BR 11164]MEA1650257.1 helix-turn-helix transcriptional regulator [Nitrospirillum sp. BR 11164]
MADPFLIRSLALTFSDGHRLHSHKHDWGQLLYAARGVMRVVADGVAWLVPPAQAVWLPPGAPHMVEMRGGVAMRTLYIAPALAAAAGAMPAGCQVLGVAPLLRELILHVVAVGMLRADRVDQARLAGVVMDRLAAAERLPLSLIWPRDRRALAVAERLRQDPADEADLEALGAAVGASARTLQRLFKEETGLRFGEWRQQLRLLHAASLLGTGLSVTQAGLEAGYGSTSAFVSAFRRRLGVTPARYRAPISAS